MSYHCVFQSVGERSSMSIHCFPSILEPVISVTYNDICILETQAQEPDYMIEAGLPRCIGRPAHLPHYSTASPLVRRQCKRTNQYIQHLTGLLFECSDNHRRYCSKDLPRCSLVSPVTIIQRVPTSYTPLTNHYSFPGAQIRRG